MSDQRPEASLVRSAPVNTRHAFASPPGHVQLLTRRPYLSLSTCFHSPPPSLSHQPPPLPFAVRRNPTCSYSAMSWKLIIPAGAAAGAVGMTLMRVEESRRSDCGFLGITFPWEKASTGSRKCECGAAALRLPSPQHPSPPSPVADARGASHPCPQSTRARGRGRRRATRPFASPC